MMAAFGDETQCDEVDASIESVDVDGQEVNFSFEAVRPDGSTYRVEATEDIPGESLLDVPAGSMQKVVYLKATPEVCLLKRFQKVEPADMAMKKCRSYFALIFGWVLILASIAFMFVVVANGFQNVIYLLSALVPFALLFACIGCCCFSNSMTQVASGTVE